MDRMDSLLERTVFFFAGMPRQIQHLMKVRGFAVHIARREGLAPELIGLIEAAAIVHDVGTKPALIKYGVSSGTYQEELGPEEARRLLEGWPEETAARVCWLVGHHHSYKDIQGIDHQVLIEADFLVNLFEHSSSLEEIRRTLDSIFRTKSGIRLCQTMFSLQD